MSPGVRSCRLTLYVVLALVLLVCLWIGWRDTAGGSSRRSCVSGSASGSAWACS